MEPYLVGGILTAFFLLCHMTVRIQFYEAVLRIIVFGPPGAGSVNRSYGLGPFHQQAKIVRKTLISTVS